MVRYFGCLGHIGKRMFHGVYSAEGFHTFAQVPIFPMMAVAKGCPYLIAMRRSAERAAAAAGLPGKRTHHQGVLTVGSS